MGLTITVNNYDSFDIGYIGFMNFRLELAEIYNAKLGEMYRRWAFGNLPYTPEKPLSDKEFEDFKNIAADLLIFLAHLDTDGSFTLSDSRKVYLIIKDLIMVYRLSEIYHGQGYIHVSVRLKTLFYHSW